MNPIAIAQSASQYKTLKTIFGSNATPQKIIAANPNRVAMIISDSAGSIFLGTVDKQPSIASGLINLSLTVGWILLDFETVGPLVGEEWWSCRASGTSNTAITEIIYVPSG